MEDVEVMLRLTVMFLPLSVFFAVFNQQVLNFIAMMALYSYL